MSFPLFSLVLKKKSTWLSLALVACLAPALAQEPLLRPRAPLLVTPMVSGILLCNAGNQNTALQTLEQIEDWCVQNKQTHDLAAKSLLDQIEPGGPAGPVQLGYTLLIPLLALYEKRDGDWVINTARVKTYLDVIATMNRPVVVYLMADHYDTSSALSQELAKDPHNLLSFATGPVGSTQYLGHGVIPFTLRTDERIPVNHYRFQALRHITQQIRLLDAHAQSLVAAVTLAGELHHMYPGFEDGVGAYENIQVTDYSAASQQEFRDWLKTKYDTIERLNQRLGFQYARFADIEAPSRDIRKDTLKSFAQHYDAFAGGQLPLLGWLWDPAQRIQSLSLYVDGKRHAPVARALGRMDVYKAKSEVNTPNTGYRGVIDFRTLSTGKHVAQVIATSNGENYLVAEREFVHVPRDQSAGRQMTTPPGVPHLKPVEQLPGVQHWTDLPRALQDVYFNPMAQEWNLFRAHQVQQMLTHFYRIARASGLPAEKLYSHQIVTESNGSWNPVLFASDASVSNTVPWRNGINQYGASPYIFDYIKAKHIRAYGVPEFNPMQWKKPGAAQEAFVQHYNAGATFVSPFFVSVVPARLRAATDERVFDIAPDNRHNGNATTFDVMQRFVRQ